MLLDLATGSLDLSTGLLTAPGGGQTQLSEQECALLTYLADRAQQDVPRGELQQRVLGYSSRVLSRAVDHAVQRLRVKIEALPARPAHIVSVAGVGYRFVPLSTGRTALQLGRRRVDLDRLEVADGEEVTSLSGIEGRLLELLIAARGRPVSNEDLLREVWEVRDLSRSKLVGKAVYRLRAKLEDEPKAPRFLLTVRGRGLALEVPAEDTPPLQALPEQTGVAWVCEPPSVQMVGRHAERAEALKRLEPEGAVVTLIAAGGMGKTTLARHIGAHWSGPASFVDLTTVVSGDQLQEAMAAAHGVDLRSDGGPDPIEHALEHAGPALLILDNAESCPEAVRGLLVRLRRRAPRARFLVTSREPLRQPREQLVRMQGLQPDEARELFQRRANEAGVGDLDDSRVDELALSLQHMPLALEIAAARTPLLGVEGILKRVNEPLRLLRSTGHDPRHASLTEVLRVSWAPLPAAARRALAACALFRGPFSVDSAERVLGDDALDLLQELTDRMLLTRHADGRLATMLAVSEFALQELGSEHTAWLEGARRRMVQVFGEMADGLGALGSEPAPLSYALLGREMDGALRAFRLAVEAGWVDESARILLWTLPVLMRQRKTRRALQLISEFGGARIADPALEKAVNWRIVRAWFNAGMLDQALRASKRLQALHPCPEMDTLVLAQRIGIGPALATHAQDFQRASDRVADPSRTAAERLVLYASLVALYRDPPKRVAWSEARLQLARHEGSEWDVADAQNHYSNLLSFVGRPDDAEVHVRRMARTYERAAFGTPAVYYGMMASIRVQQGRLDEAEAFGVRCYEHASEGGAVIRMAWICGTLGKITGIRGDYEGAIAWFSRALACAEELGDHRHVALYQSNLGEAWRRQGREGEARRALQESAALFDRLGESAMVVTPLRSHGRLELDARRLERAEELLARAMSHESSGGGLRWLTQSVYAEVLARLGRDGALELAREATREALLLGRSESLANVLYHHACVAEVLGQTAESREQLDRAWELVEALGVDPDAEIRTRVQALRQDL